MCFGVIPNSCGLARRSHLLASPSQFEPVLFEAFDEGYVAEARSDHKRRFVVRFTLKLRVNVRRILEYTSCNIY